MTTGLLALMSCITSPVSQQCSCAGRGKQGGGAHTKDRRYESNDSREMGKCSMSPVVCPGARLALRSVEVRDR